MQDAKREQIRRGVRRRERWDRGRERGGGGGEGKWRGGRLRERVGEAYEAAQGWIVVMIIGM